LIGIIMAASPVMDGVERRVLTAGRNKALMDPFAPQDAQQQAFVQGLLDDIHGQFIAAVREGRGDRLKESPELFSGLVWNGRRAVDLLAGIRQRS
jgi:protease-4